MVTDCAFVLTRIHITQIILKVVRGFESEMLTKAHSVQVPSKEAPTNYLVQMALW